MRKPAKQSLALEPLLSSGQLCQQMTLAQAVTLSASLAQVNPLASSFVKWACQYLPCYAVDSVDPRREFSGSGLHHPASDMYGKTLVGLTHSVSEGHCSASSLLTPAFPPSHHSLQGHTVLLTNKSKDQLFSFGILLLQLKFQGLQGEAAENTTGALPHFKAAFIILHTPFSGPLVCSLGNQIPWRFSSVISLFTELWPWTSCLYLICTCPHGP